MKNKNYNVEKTKYDLDSISNDFDNYLWKDVTVLSDFTQPWDNRSHKETIFKALYDDAHLYMRFDVVESTEFCSNAVNRKIDVAEGERVEVFFRKDEKLEQYYCLEISPKGFLLDYSASYYREFNYDWSWLREDIIIKSKYVSNSYSILIKISLDSLSSLGLLKNNIIEAGIYRGRCVKQLNRKKKDIQWVTWIDPKTKTPDFHVPASFGRIILV